MTRQRSPCRQTAQPYRRCLIPAHAITSTYTDGRRTAWPTARLFVSGIQCSDIVHSAANGAGHRSANQARARSHRPAGPSGPTRARRPARRRAELPAEHRSAPPTRPRAAAASRAGGRIAMVLPVIRSSRSTRDDAGGADRRDAAHAWGAWRRWRRPVSRRERSSSVLDRCWLRSDRRSGAGGAGCIRTRSQAAWGSAHDRDDAGGRARAGRSPTSRPRRWM